jgi:hypothetical protein
MKIGIIAEDDSDVAVLREITLKLIGSSNVGFSKFVGDGCGKLRRKCGAWAKNLVRQGCPWVVVLHDLDTFNEGALRAQLTASVLTCGARLTVVLIPRRELEAWLLYDAAAIAAAFREHQLPKVPGNPENLADPKKHLRDLVWRKYKKHYLNTIHNAVIASHIKVALLEKSGSFAPHVVFTKSLKARLNRH